MTLQLIKKAAFATPIFMLGMLGCAQHAIAAHPMVTDDTGTQGAGNNQVELNADYITERDGSRATIGGATYSRGLTDTVDFFVDQPMVLSEQRGIGDTSLGMKWRFFDRDGTSLAFKSTLSMANANEEKGFGSGRHNLSALLILSQNFKAWSFHYNLGIESNRFKSPEMEEANRRSIWKASAATTYSLTPQLKAVGDIGIERNSDIANRKNPAYALTGIIYSPSPMLDLDAGMKFGLNDASIRRQFGAGVAIHF